MNKNYIKIVLLGDGRVGKTSILNRYINNTFDDKQEIIDLWISLGIPSFKVYL